MHYLMVSVVLATIHGKPLGRPPKESKTEGYQLKMAKAVGERNEIETTLGDQKENLQSE